MRNVPLRLLFALIISGLASGCQSFSEFTSPKARFEVASPASDFPVKVPSAYTSTLGWLVVPEDRKNPKSSEIRLAVAIIHSRSDSGKSPVLYLSGGPGTSAMNTAAYPGAYPWLEDRDFIVIGQRGTHYADPALMCGEFRKAVAAEAGYVEAVRACRERLEASGIGLQNYNSLTSAEDLEDLRKVLEIDTWNLYGVSYGTRLALYYAKSHGKHVDAMVLDSPLPPNAIYDDESAENLEKSLRALAKDCASQAACRAAFPDLEQRFFTAVEELATRPVKVEGVDSIVDGASLASLVPIGSEDDVRDAPGFMDRLARLDPALLRRLDGTPEATDFAWGMRFSVWCSEALPFSRRSRAEKPGTTLGGIESAAFNPEYCKAWGVEPLGSRVVEPVTSYVPSLILVGEFDPGTPPAWGQLAARTLSRSKVVTVRGESHLPSQNWGGDGCAMSLAAAFFKDPADVLDGSDASHCVFDRSAPKYRVPSE